MEFISEFPELGRGDLRDFKKAVDFGFRSFSRAYGEGIESFFDPLLQFMIWFERLLINSPWPIILAVIAGLAWLGSRSWKLVVGSVACFVAIGFFGMWENTMATLAIISVATLVCIGVGIPLGIWMAKSNRAQSIITPILDVMQKIGRAHVRTPVTSLSRMPSSA